MKESKIKILENICYTELVYERINKKLNSNHSKDKLKKMLFSIIEKTNERYIEKKGKNFYISNTKNNIRITVNSNTYRVITVDVLRR